MTEEEELEPWEAEEILRAILKKRPDWRGRVATHMARLSFYKKLNRSLPEDLNQEILKLRDRLEMLESE